MKFFITAFQSCYSKVFRRFGLIILLVYLNSPVVHAEIFPVKTYTTADGLLRDDVVQVAQDSKGFIWIRSHGGLVRFDGYTFKKFTIEDGLPSPHVHWFQESFDRNLWISTAEGLVRFNPSGISQKFDVNNPTNPEALFQVFQLGSDWESKGFGIVVQTRKDLLWASTADGLIKITLNNNQPAFNRTEITSPLTFLMKDSQNNLWGSIENKGVFKMLPDETVTFFNEKNGIPIKEDNLLINIQAMTEDLEGHIWIGGNITGGVCRLVKNPQPSQNVIDFCITEKDGLSSDWIYWIQQTNDGAVWITTREKLTKFIGFDEKKKPILEILGSRNGLSDKIITDFEEDRDGNYWIPTQNGVKKILRQGFTKFDDFDGLQSFSFSSIFQNLNGELTIIEHPNKLNISIFKDGKFSSAHPNGSGNIDFREDWNSGQKGKKVVLQDRDGEWWIATGNQNPHAPFLLRFAKTANHINLARMKPKVKYYRTQAPKITESFQLFEDSKGNIWLPGFKTGNSLYCWDRNKDKFIDYSDIADIGEGYFQTFVEDAFGNLWFGGSVIGKSDPGKTIKLLRYKNGQFQSIKSAENLPGIMNNLFVDGKQRLWVASPYNGLLRFDDSNADEPSFTAYTMTEGLSDNMIFTVTEDKFGRIYAGSGRGVNRLNLETNLVRQFSTKDGLPSGNVYLSKTDKTGAIWFATSTGLARLIPEIDKPRQLPNIFITGLRVAGESQKVSIFGEAFLPNMDFSANKNNLTIDYLGLGASLGEELRYEYQLGGNDSEWIATNERSLNFANLAAGNYQFAVRAVTHDGLTSQSPATFSFTVLKPLYLNPWFLIFTGLLIGFAVWQIYRFRVRRLLEIERTRTRIATDLHDDIGADLSKISLLSEVVKMQMTNGNEENSRLLSKIAETSRKSVETMRDIVWAINPSHDSPEDLVHKMRQFAEDTLVEKNIKLIFNAPNDNQNLKLSMDTRRELYLIFKEAVTNAAKYSECSEVKIDFEIVGKEIRLTVKDNGNGFDSSQEHDGNGLKNMRNRAKNLHGKMEITSDQGTIVSVIFTQNQ